MKFLHTDLGQRTRGEVVQVALRGNAVNVRLMDPVNFSRYRSGQAHRFYGGGYSRSPVRLAIPQSGRWHLCVDLGGLPGRFEAAVEVLPGLLRSTRISHAQQTLERIIETAAGYASEVGADDSERQYDVFISHASEDKESVVRDLASALRNRGLIVWYDEFELRIGDSLRRKIDEGIRTSRFGVVVLSPAFFSKGWPQYELDGLVTRQTSGEQVILPLWHGVNKQQVADQSPSLADRVALRTSTLSLDDIATQIAEVIGEPP